MVYPMIYRVSTIQGASFFSSTVVIIVIVVIVTWMMINPIDSKSIGCTKPHHLGACPYCGPTNRKPVVTLVSEWG
jgi:hypothetical protein